MKPELEVPHSDPRLLEARHQVSGDVRDEVPESIDDRDRSFDQLSLIPGPGQHRSHRLVRLDPRPERAKPHASRGELGGERGKDVAAVKRRAPTFDTE